MLYYTAIAELIKIYELFILSLNHYIHVQGFLGATEFECVFLIERGSSSTCIPLFMGIHQGT